MTEEWLEGISWANAARPLTREEAHQLIEQAKRAQEMEKLYDGQLEVSQTTYDYFKSEIKQLQKKYIETKNALGARELENTRLNDDWKGTQEVLRKSIELLDASEAENTRFREALERIVTMDKEAWDTEHEEFGLVARTALEEKTNGMLSDNANSNREKPLKLNADDFKRIIHALKFRREHSSSKSHKRHMDKFIEKVEYINGKR